MPAADFRYPRALAEWAVPGFELAFEFAHEFAGVGAVDDAMVEAEAVVLHGADGDGVVAFGVGEDDGFFLERADGEDGGLGLIDNGETDLIAEDSGIGEGEGRSADFVGGELLGARAAGEVGDRSGEIREAALFGFADGGHDESPLEGDGDAEIEIGVIVDGVVDERRIDDGVVAQCLNGGDGDERHVGELDAVALLEGSPFAIAEARYARHVDLVNGVDMRADALALDHALGDDRAHPGKRHHVGLEGLRRHPWWDGLRLWRLGCGGSLVDVSKDVLFVDAAVGARAGDIMQIDVVFFGYATDEGRRADVFRAFCGDWLRDLHDSGLCVIG